MNKNEIEVIIGYCKTISALCNKINHEFEHGKYIAFFDINLMGWITQVRKNEVDSRKVWRMELNSWCNITNVEHGIYKPTPENFELAITKLQGCLKEMQEEEAVS